MYSQPEGEIGFVFLIQGMRCTVNHLITKLKLIMERIKENLK